MLSHSLAPMRLKSILPALLAGLLFAGSGTAGAAWTHHSGDDLPGEPVAFDLEEKTITFHDPLSDREMVVPTRQLSLRSKQQLLFSPLFHRQEGEEFVWTPEKRRILLQGVAIPAGVLLLAFWLSAWFFTGKINPLLALIGFIGSWVVILILAVCYAFIEMRLEGGLKIILLGIAVTLGVTPLYLSAVYNCNYWKSQGTLLSHLLVGFCLMSIGLVASEVIAGKNDVEFWWDRNVFEPIGLIGPDPAMVPPAP